MTEPKTSAKVLRRLGINQYQLDFSDGTFSEFEYPDSKIIQLADALGFRQYIDDLEAHLEYLPNERVGVLLTNDLIEDIDDLIK